MRIRLVVILGVLAWSVPIASAQTTAADPAGSSSPAGSEAPVTICTAPAVALGQPDPGFSCVPGQVIGDATQPAQASGGSTSSGGPSTAGAPETGTLPAPRTFPPCGTEAPGSGCQFVDNEGRLVTRIPGTTPFEREATRVEGLVCSEPVNQVATCVDPQGRLVRRVDDFTPPPPHGDRVATPEERDALETQIARPAQPTAARTLALTG